MRLLSPRVSRHVTVALLCVMILVPAAHAQTDPPFIPTEAQRARLAQAADDANLPAWQRDLMRDLAGAGEATTAPAAVDAPAAFDGTWSELVVDSRWSHCAVHDPVRDRLVVFGGVDSTNRYLNDTWVLTLADPPAWHRLEPGGEWPRPRTGASMVYDRRRDRIVVYGGRASSDPYILGDVWALPLANVSSWERLGPAGSAPFPRYGHVAVFDPNRDHMVVFGGIDSTYAFRNDAWTLSFTGTPAWTALTPTGAPPSPRWEHAAIHDPVRGRMLVHGGLTSGGYVNDVWALSLSPPHAWTALAPTGTPPPARAYHALAYDPPRDRMLVYGGSPSGEWQAFVWTLTLSGTPQWSYLLAVEPMPGRRLEPVAVYDPARDRLVVFGGDTETGGARNDVWAFDLASTLAWTELTPTGRTPDERGLASAIWDAPRGRMVVFGGTYAPAGMRNDVHVLALTGAAAWSAPAVSGTPPSPRYGHSAIVDPVRERMIVYGGWVGTADWYSNEVWSLTLSGTPTWSLLAPTGAPPVPRAYHTAVYDAARDRMLVYGGHGYDGVVSGTRSDTWALSLATPAWTMLTPTGTPFQRQYHSAIYDPVRDRMVVFAGEAGLRYNDVQALSLAGAPAWTTLAPAGTPPSARSGHVAIYDPPRDRMVVCGGSPGGATADVWAMSLAGTPAWTPLAPASVPPPTRAGHSGVYDAARDRMIVFGPGNDVWALSWSVPLGVDPAPVPGSALLRPPVPNPARGGATVAFTLTRTGAVRLRVYDVNGRLVRTLIDAAREAGAGSVRWDGRDGAGARVRPGVYLVQLVAPEASSVQRLVVLE